MSITKARGTRDLLPEELIAYRRVEETAREVFERFGYGEIRTPMFERTELFVRGIGEATDIVSKEMYTFEDRGGRSVTLRPEGTAGVVRAAIENNLFGQSFWRKFYYVGPMFRYERPQKGRYREFWQAGVEWFGVHDAWMDADVIACAYQFLQALGLKNLCIRVNTVDKGARSEYIKALKKHVEPHLDKLGEHDRQRFEQNPLRLHDTKDPNAREILSGGPSMVDYLAQSADYFTTTGYLKSLNIPFIEDPSIVRGIDYYTGTVFEITTEGLGAQDAILAGGRYNDLVRDMGGPDVWAVGFAAGIDRLVLAMEAQKVSPPSEPSIDVVVAKAGKVSSKRILKVLWLLRQKGFRADTDYDARSLKGVLRNANKKNTPFVVILGEDEVKDKKAILHFMNTGEEKIVPLEVVASYLSEHINSQPNS